ncbi:hypothetical protein ACK389_00850 [Streptomyces antibioticus]|uniref:Uncharacterized protein n=1 Tax=Streptomyces antibioticus TaxID=1890 RepID=A0AAE6YGR5_STRAT|nr:hypothetical protein [Streptomyces antibioticus]QIT48459.1 hypothetical protein HCX60_37160 [Streptomyces antibioticus]
MTRRNEQGARRGSGFCRLRDNKIVEATLAEAVLGPPGQLTASDPGTAS